AHLGGRLRPGPGRRAGGQRRLSGLRGPMAAAAAAAQLRSRPIRGNMPRPCGTVGARPGVRRATSIADPERSPNLIRSGSPGAPAGPRSHVHERQSMAVVIRMMRAGAKKRPFYRVVVADSRRQRDGRFVEILGYYDPMAKPHAFKIDEDKVK